MRDMRKPFRMVADLSAAAESPEAQAIVRWLLTLVSSIKLTPPERRSHRDGSDNTIFDNLERLESEFPGIASNGLTEANEVIDRIRIPLAAMYKNREGPLPKSLQQHVRSLCSSSMKVHSSPYFGEESEKFTLLVDWDISSLKSKAYFALALLAASPSLRARLGKCALEECGDYFLDDPTRGGKRRVFCRWEHSDIGRARLYRERMKDKPVSKRKPK